MSALIIFIGFIAGGTLLLWVLTRKSPAGYQDETGFHFGLDTGYGPHNAVEQINNVPNTEIVFRGAAPDEAFAPFFPLRFPGLIRGFGLIALLVSLIVFPKASKNIEPVSPHTDGAVITDQADFKTMPDTVLVAFTSVEDSRFSPKLCVRFSQVD